MFLENKKEYKKNVVVVVVSTPTQNNAPCLESIDYDILNAKWLDIQRPIYYKWFNFDIFIISLYFNLFNSSLLPLKLNIVYREQVNFLDLDICVDSFRRKVSFKLFVKKTNTYSYLQTTFNHPKHVFDNIPKSIFYWSKKNCTYISNYLYFSTIFVL